MAGAGATPPKTALAYVFGPPARSLLGVSLREGRPIGSLSRLGPGRAPKHGIDSEPRTARKRPRRAVLADLPPSRRDQFVGATPGRGNVTAWQARGSPGGPKGGGRSYHGDGASTTTKSVAPTANDLAAQADGRAPNVTSSVRKMSQVVDGPGTSSTTTEPERPRANRKATRRKVARAMLRPRPRKCDGTLMGPSHAGLPRRGPFAADSQRFSEWGV